MLIPTDDAFLAVAELMVPVDGKVVSTDAMAYDAGSKPNDELCASIPGSVCGGAGGSPGVGREGFVHVLAGIHGIGELDPAERDWQNPVAKITVVRIHWQSPWGLQLVRSRYFGVRPRREAAV